MTTRLVGAFRPVKHKELLNNKTVRRQIHQEFHTDDMTTSQSGRRRERERERRERENITT